MFTFYQNEVHFYIHNGQYFKIVSNLGLDFSIHTFYKLALSIPNSADNIAVQGCVFEMLCGMCYIEPVEMCYTEPVEVRARMQGCVFEMFCEMRAKDEKERLLYSAKCVTLSLSKCVPKGGDAC